MVFYLTILLGVSITGMLMLLLVKRYELASGNLVFAGSRPKIAKFSNRMVFLFGTAVPLYLRWQAERAYSSVAGLVHRVVAYAAVKTEYWLEHVLRNVREKTTPSREAGEASAFLREVGEYKKKLTETTEENTIHQE